mgnify:CR=1 FL=1|jgi:3-phenylpropionate/trans-cinnamate dioxygenase ferredoxin subunit
MSDRIRVAAEEDIPQDEGLVIPKALTGADDDIALFKDDQGCIFALDNTCPHEVASLAEGWVEDGYVECPLHSSKFDLRTGEAQSLPAPRGVNVHRVEVHDGEVYLYAGERP